MPLITLTTDFGLTSHYPAQMKGVILTLAPTVRIVDITHGIRPQQVRTGSVILADVAPHFPPGTLHVAVIDPGVGTARQLVYAEIGEQRYLAPDNGSLTAVESQFGPVAKAFYLEAGVFWRPSVSSTFHGRDILAPVAAHLTNGLLPDQLGPVCRQLVRLPWPQVRCDQDHVLGEILLVDSFGNLITNINSQALTSLGPLEEINVQCRGIEVYGVQRTYGQSAPGQNVAILDSQGRLEIAVVNGNAAELWGLKEGATVEVRRSPKPD